MASAPLSFAAGTPTAISARLYALEQEEEEFKRMPAIPSKLNITWFLSERYCVTLRTYCPYFTKYWVRVGSTGRKTELLVQSRGSRPVHLTVAALTLHSAVRPLCTAILKTRFFSGLQQSRCEAQAFNTAVSGETGSVQRAVLLCEGWTWTVLGGTQTGFSFNLSHQGTIKPHKVPSLFQVYFLQYKLTLKTQEVISKLWH